MRRAPSRAAPASRNSRTSWIATRSSAAMVATTTPRRGCSTASPCATSPSTASRTGLRDTLSRRASSGTLNCSPARSAPPMIASRSAPCTASTSRCAPDSAGSACKVASPAIDALPAIDHGITLHDVEDVVGRTGDTGMIRQHADKTADRQAFEPGVVVDRHRAVLLVHVVDGEIAEPYRRPRIAHPSIAGAGEKPVGADILRQRERAGVENDGAPRPVVADDRREHRHGDIVDAAHVARELREIEHHVNAGTHLGDAVEMVDVQYRGGRADADDLARQAGGADGGGCGHRRVAL